MKRIIGIICFVKIITVDAAHIGFEITMMDNKIKPAIRSAAIISSVNPDQSHNRADLYLISVAYDFQIYQNITKG